MNTAIEIQNNEKKIKDMIREFQIEQSQLAKSKKLPYGKLIEKYRSAMEKISQLKTKTTKSSSKSFLTEESRSRDSIDIKPNITTSDEWLSYYNFDVFGGETIVDQAIYISPKIKDKKRAIQRLWKVIEEKEPKFLRRCGDEK